MENPGVAPPSSGWKNIQSYESRQRAYLENLRVQKQNYMLYRDLAMGNKKYKCTKTPPNSPNICEDGEEEFQIIFVNTGSNIEQEESSVNLSPSTGSKAKNDQLIALGIPKRNLDKKLLENSAKSGFGEGSGSAAVMNLNSAYDKKLPKTHFVPYSTVSSSNNRLFTADQNLQEKMPYYFSGYCEDSSSKFLDKTILNAKPTFSKSSKKPMERRTSSSIPLSLPNANTPEMSSVYRGQSKRELALLHKRIFNTGLSSKTMN